MRAPIRHRFDATREFIVRKPTTVSGRHFERLSPFDSTLVSARRLEQMFRQRTIVYADQPAPGEKLSAEETDKTHRGQHAKRAAAVQAKRAKEKAAKLAAEKAGKAAKPGRSKKPAPTETVTDPAAVRVARAAVTIPADWPTLPWPKRLQLAAQLTDEKVKNGEDAAKAIEAELARRGTS